MGGHVRVSPAHAPSAMLPKHRANLVAEGVRSKRGDRSATAASTAQYARSPSVNQACSANLARSLAPNPVGPAMNGPLSFSSACVPAMSR